MFDTMTLTKTVGALCGSLLVLLLSSWAAEELYHSAAHGDGDIAQAYVIDTGAEEVAETEETVDVVAILAAGDVAEGEKVFSKCSACHKMEAGANGTGPYLAGVVNRAVGGASGFGGYSGALSAVADVWTPEALYAFLENPRAYAPGNKMSFAGLRRPEERADVIAYLASVQ